MSRKMVFKMEMTCEGCADAAKKVLKKLGDGVSDIVTDVEAKTVTVTTTRTQDEILETLGKTGKEVSFLSST